MTIADWLMILAVLTGPVIAVRLTRFLDNRKEIRERKLNIFKTLMATRAYAVSWDHVMTLNKIDLEFDKSNKKERDVIEAWKEYLDLLGNKDISGEAWNVRRVDLLVELLHKMAKVLDFDFDKTHIKNSSYSPVAQSAVRQGVIEILEGKRVLPMYITNWPANGQS
jgi:hypothetical protein